MCPPFLGCSLTTSNGMRPTGKPLDLPVVHVWDIQDGKAVRFRNFADTVKFADVVPVADSVAG